MQIEDEEQQEQIITEYVSESQLDEIVKKYVQKPVDDADRELKMMVLSLVSDLRNCRAECEGLKVEVERISDEYFKLEFAFNRENDERQRLQYEVERYRTALKAAGIPESIVDEIGKGEYS